jgi:hypothetical protein
MVRQVTPRLLRRAVRGTLATLLLATPLAAGLTVVAPTAASAAGPDTISMTGPGIQEAVTVRAADSPEQFAALLTEVNWLSSRPGQDRGPDAKTLGSKYVLTISTGRKATNRYELYPMANGGPRVFRPANQPDRHRVTAAWFYGRLSMPDALRGAGAPLPSTVVSVSTGGIGGGQVADKTFDPNADLTSMLAEWRHFVLLNGAVVVVIALGLAGTSLLVRRRVDRLYLRAEQGRAPVRRRR